MADGAPLERILSPIVAWAHARTDILGLALVGSQARGTALPDSDVDLVVLATEPQMFRRNERWLTEISWTDTHVAAWHDAPCGIAWSRHVALSTRDDIEFTFCKPSWAATDPVDAGTANVVSGGCRVMVDKAKLFENLLKAMSP